MTLTDRARTRRDHRTTRDRRIAARIFDHRAPAWTSTLTLSPLKDFRWGDIVGISDPGSGLYCGPR